MSERADCLDRLISPPPRRAVNRLLPCLTMAIGLVACSPQSDSSGKGAADRNEAVSASVRQVHREVAAAVDLADPAGFQDARRGFIAAPSGQVRDASGQVIWDFDAFRFVEGAAPPTVNPSLWRQALLNNQVGLFAVVPGIWQLRGFDLANITLIEGRTGWIVVDTATSRETAAAAMAFARRHLGDRPVTGVVFTHSHVDHFGGVLGVISAEEARRRSVPVVAPAGFIEEATSENLMMGVAMGRRSMYLYGSRLPRDPSGIVDNGLGKAPAYGSVGILPPTLIVDAERQPIEIDGRQFVFHNVPGSEAPAELVFYLPELKAFGGAEIMGHTLHNLYTLRGAKVRDALKWAGYLDRSLAQAAQAEVLFNQHHWPVWGTDRIADFIGRQRDVYKYLHDQTVRQMNAGMDAADIAETLTLPKVLQQHLSVRGYYGTVRHNVKAIVQHYLGWYDGNPANLDPLPPREAARRYVSLAGGAGPLLAHAQEAFARGEFRWCAEVLKHLVYADPSNAPARELQARAFEQLGFAAESASWRNVYLTGALELRRGPPAQGLSASMLADLLRHAPTERFLERMAASIDGAAAQSLRLTINLVFSDSAERHVLRLRDGILHHRAAAPVADAQATLTLSRAFFLRMMMGEVGVLELLRSPEVRIDGNVVDLGRFLSLLERPPGNFPLVTR